MAKLKDKKKAPRAAQTGRNRMGTPSGSQKAPAQGKVLQLPDPRKAKKRPKPTEFERYKQKILARRKANAILGVIVLSLAAAGVVIGFGLLSESEFGVQFRARFSHTAEYPVSLQGSSVRQMEALGWDLSLLSDTSLSVYNSKGQQTYSANHGFAAPVLKVKGTRALVYDQGGTRFTVSSATREQFSGVASGNIHAADVSADGSLALVSSTSRNATELKVYDSFGATTHTWTNANITTSMALSPDGKQALIALASSDGGRMMSTLYLLDVQSTEKKKPLFELSLPGEFVYQVMFKSQTVGVVTDQSVKSIDMMGRVRANYDYGGQQILLFADGGMSNTVLVMGNYRYMRESEVISLDDKCRVQGSFFVGDTLENLKAGDLGFTFLSEGMVHHYDYKGTLVSKTKVDGAVHYLPIGQSLFVATYDELQKLELR